MLLKKIEDIFQDYVHKNSTKSLSVLALPNRKIWKNTSYTRERGLKLIENPILQKIGNRSGPSSQKLIKVMHVLTKIHSLIKSNTYRTKRELYYEDVTIFKSQKELDDILDDLACLLKTPKVQLHVLTTSKGCIAGHLKFKEAEGNYIDCSKTTQGILLPNDISSITYIQSDARFILLVEKSAVFQMLLDSNFIEEFQPCILITGKGFPDVNTREMLRKLWDVLEIPILGLVDADPYGIEILCVYKFGSMAMSFDVEKLAVPEIRWLGLLQTDIQRLKFPTAAVTPLTENDMKKAMALLSRPYIQNNIQWQRQIQLMLEQSVKAEIEGLSKLDSLFLSSIYLPNKIKYGGWI
ncbi:meiotic recombination protein SPO11 isoform X2 [Parasteatoda tepidariorum]